MAPSSTRAAAAALLLFGCASGDAELRREVAALREELAAMRRESAEASRKVDALGSRVDQLAALPPRPSARVAEQPPAPPGAPAAATAPAPLVPTGLKVVRLVAPPSAPAAARKAPPAVRRRPPDVPTTTPIRDPDPATLAALGAGGKDLAAEARAALDGARAQSGLARARALEQFTAGYPGHPSADDALVEAARMRDREGDPDGSCEDFARASKEYPAGDAMPDALAGLAACEARRGRAAEARRLETRLAQDFPDSPAARRARASAAQGAAP